ncbi:MAG: hypothetical protein PHE49_04140, partial [bacterium]|nr:hypothetical protein [bacterium]
IFTMGDLPIPQILVMEITDSYIELQLKNFPPAYQLGVIVMDSETLKISTLYPEYCPDIPLNIPFQLNNPMVFLYYKKDKGYSPSLRIYPTLQ